MDQTPEFRPRLELRVCIVTDLRCLSGHSSCCRSRQRSTDTRRKTSRSGGGGWLGRRFYYARGKKEIQFPAERKAAAAAASRGFATLAAPSTRPADRLLRPRCPADQRTHLYWKSEGEKNLRSSFSGRGHPSPSEPNRPARVPSPPVAATSSSSCVAREATTHHHCRAPGGASSTRFVRCRRHVHRQFAIGRTET